MRFYKMINEIDRQQPNGKNIKEMWLQRHPPDALYYAAEMLNEQQLSEVYPICFSDNPFDLYRSIARAFKIVEPRLQFVAEDSRVLAVRLPGTPSEFLLGLIHKVSFTPEGIVAGTLSSAYRMWIPEMNLFSRVMSEHLYYFSTQEIENWTPETVNFARMATKRLWGDVIEAGIEMKANKDFIENVANWPELPLSYEGYLATLKTKIEEVLPQINGTS